MEDGDLVEMASGGKVASSKLNRFEQQRWLSGLLQYAQAHGYKAGWAPHKFKEKFGFWPDNFLNNPSEPGADVLAYVRSTQIRFAKRKKLNAA